MMEKLLLEEIKEKLENLENWNFEDDHLTKSFVFDDFEEAISFINKAAKIAEKMNHHPDIYLENYKEITLKLKTHFVDGITEKDFELANEINALA